jgi:hypothetical protein
MQNNSLVSEVRNRYISLTKTFFRELEEGKDLADLQSLQEEIEKTLLELDLLEKQDLDTSN